MYALSLSPVDAIAYLGRFFSILPWAAPLPRDLTCPTWVAIHSTGLSEDPVARTHQQEVLRAFEFDHETFPAGAIQGRARLLGMRTYRHPAAFVRDRPRHGCTLDDRRFPVRALVFGRAYFLTEPLYDVLPTTLSAWWPLPFHLQAAME
ncbi:MAG TPA: hypothetical protein DCQ32_07620 [Cyanobacteria bacterium UBA8156]|jgi:hypothetical protein|nr:hypothetical protein [Cyanobacteria bacterium UBA8156]